MIICQQPAPIAVNNYDPVLGSAHAVVSRLIAGLWVDSLNINRPNNSHSSNHNLIHPIHPPVANTRPHGPARKMLKVAGPPTRFNPWVAVTRHPICGDRLLATARGENDYAAEVMLHWFVDEQVEEEANSSQIAEQLKMIKDSPNGLMMMDRGLGARE